LRRAAAARAANVAGRVDFPAPSTVLSVGAGLRPRLAPRSSSNPPDRPTRCSVRRSPDTVPKDHVDANLPGLRSPSELNRSPWSGKRPSLLGSVRAARPIGPVSAPVAPPPTFPPSVNSGAESYSALRPHGSPREVTFRPRGFAPPRRFPPLDGLRACCIPLPVMRFAAFPSFPTRRSPERLPRSAGFVPLEGISVDSRTASPRPLPSCRSPAATAAARDTPLPV